MGFAHQENSADLCATDVNVFACANTVELVLSHHESRCIRCQYSYMIEERRTIPLWPNNCRQAELVFNQSYADSTEYIERKLTTLLLEAMGFVYNEDNADLSSAHVKDITNQSPVKLVLSHQESRCICYPYFSHAGERTTISLWHNKDRQAELISKRSAKCRPNFTECLDSAFPDHFEGFI